MLMKKFCRCAELFLFVYLWQRKITQSMRIKEICAEMELMAPLSLQEDYDNAGLQVGDPEKELTGVLLTLDVTTDVVKEAHAKNCNLIVAHHPLIFRGLKKIVPQSDVQRSVMLALELGIAIYAAHTNIDNAANGMNAKIAQKLGLKNFRTLCPSYDKYLKLVTYVPKNKVKQLDKALFDAGAGCIGNYDCCTYRSQGEGTFRAKSEECHPYVGKVGAIHTEPEIRYETVLPEYLREKVTRALLEAHPYEEPAYDFYSLTKTSANGTGGVGDLAQEMTEADFLNHVKDVFKIPVVRHTAFLNRKIKKVAFVGGAGISFLHDALASKADVFLTSDIKYHDFFLAENKILIADFGHFESEQYIKETFFDIIRKKIPNFVIQISEINTNPINYL